MNDRRVLITGAAGMMGANLMQDWASRYEVIGCYHSRKIGKPWAMVPLNLTDELDTLRTVVSVRPDLVVHCAALTAVDVCETNQTWAWNVNANGTRYLAAACAEVNARLVYISTDAVFDGTKGNYSETDTPNPVNVYAKTKLAGEIASSLYRDDTLIVRTNIYGHSLDPERPSAVDRLLRTLEAGQEYRAWANVWTSPILVNDLADALYHLIEAGCEGVYHVGSSGEVTRYAFARIVAIFCGVKMDRLFYSMLRDGDMPAKRPEDTSLDVSKAQEVLTERGYWLQEADFGIERFAAMREEKKA